MNKLLSICALVVSLLCAATAAQATLFDRGNGLIYDSFDNLSWTQNGSLSGYGNWDSQLSFAQELVLAGYDDFILATSRDMQGLYSELPGADGSDKSGTQGPFVGIQHAYWSRTSDSTHAVVFSFLGGDQASVGKEFAYYGWAVRFGDSVGIGGPPPVPEPPTALLLGLGLMVLRWPRWWRGRRAFRATHADPHPIG